MKKILLILLASSLAFAELTCENRCHYCPSKKQPNSADKALACAGLSNSFNTTLKQEGGAEMMACIKKCFPKIYAKWEKQGQISTEEILNDIMGLGIKLPDDFDEK